MNANFLNVITYNIRNDNDIDAQAGHGWQTRRLSQVTRSLRGASPDIIGLQEVYPWQFEDLKVALPNFDSYGTPRDDGKEKGEMAAILWLNTRFEKLDADTLWLSETPKKPSLGWDATLPRVVTRVSLRDRTCGTILTVWNTHLDHRSETARIGGAKLIADWSSQVGNQSPSQILLGDFNCQEESSPVQVLQRSGWQLVNRSNTPDLIGPEATAMPDFIFSENNPRIDHILFKGNLRPTTRETILALENALLPSDHLPVKVHFGIEGSS
ncbi:MAG: endonuclease/exonuclease/phosphatase family protein [Puniceicoccaceae bacterium]